MQTIDYIAIFGVAFICGLIVSWLIMGSWKEPPK